MNQLRRSNHQNENGDDEVLVFCSLSKQHGFVSLTLIRMVVDPDRKKCSSCPNSILCGYTLGRRRIGDTA